MDSELLAFCHLGKTGGTSVNAMLQKSYGIRHLDVFSPKGGPYTPDEMKFDLRIHPLARSLAGHGLRPFVNFGSYENRLVWFTWLRNPINRYLSHYQHYVEKHHIRESFAEWSADPKWSNWQVVRLAGEPDVAAAKQLIAAKVRFVGLLERFNESMAMLPEAVGNSELRIRLAKPRNTSITGATVNRINEDAERYHDMICEKNALDSELYRWVEEDLFPRQVAQFGADRLSDAVNQMTPAGGYSSPVREFASKAVRKFYYMSMLRVASALRITRARNRFLINNS